MREPPTIAGFIADSIARVGEVADQRADAIEVAYREAVCQLQEERARADHAEALLRAEIDRTTARDNRMRDELRRFRTYRSGSRDTAIDRLVAQLKAELGE